MEVRHGETIRLEDIRAMRAAITAANESMPFNVALNFTGANQQRFDFLFPALAADPENRLPEGPETRENLKALGAAMLETGNDGDSEIPAGFTYLGQFIDHDLTLTANTEELQRLEDVTEPLPQEVVTGNIENLRNPLFDLDSVYDNNRATGINVPRDPDNNDLLLIGTVVEGIPQRPPGTESDNNHDLPRANAVAQIGDARNDENTIVAQLHTAFLRFHRAVVSERDLGFDEARKIVVQHYQSVVLNDFLTAVCDPKIVEEIKTNGNRIFKPDVTGTFMPLEYSVAAYRFGHTLVREEYDFNINFNPATLSQLFTFSQLSGDIFGLPRLPENWIIEWGRFFNQPQPARAVNTRLVPTLFDLRKPGGGSLSGVFQKLAQRNLLRGFLFGLPTGQAIAKHLFGEYEVLAPEDILQNAAVGDERTAVEAGNFHGRTPLWYYILAEAAIQQQGRKLGRLGSTLVAETVIGLLRVSPHSILSQEEWSPSLPTANETFKLTDLLRFAGVLE